MVEVVIRFGDDGKVHIESGGLTPEELCQRLSDVATYISEATRLNSKSMSEQESPRAPRINGRLREL